MKTISIPSGTIIKLNGVEVKAAGGHIHLDRIPANLPPAVAGGDNASSDEEPQCYVCGKPLPADHRARKYCPSEKNSGCKKAYESILTNLMSQVRVPLRVAVHEILRAQRD